VYTAITFWKLYSTSRAIPYGLMTDHSPLART
jgi:hypothetical protein